MTELVSSAVPESLSHEREGEGRGGRGDASAWAGRKAEKVVAWRCLDAERSLGTPVVKCCVRHIQIPTP